ncbi:DUF4357 domain-containing protein [Halomonas mongoliensis]|uniref:DUF4357 domain-containing protein n=1 Tax=Halomonas mongoliensis TaxID=321265 RepID=A0ABU1GK29_9GAMM|nr:DUF4357 domain-containing protein [Halomonas mongoliensis]MDR5892328.1 DUF4357 domain-containing protein [Halomonas mongoliensis]
MTQGRSIRLFLVYGTPHGLLTAEIMNWTGHVLTRPRSKLSELVQRPECGRTAIYFLVGPDPENSLRPLVYIGESDEVPRHGIRAIGQEIDGEFYVFKGSLARGSWVGIVGGYQSLYNQLCEDGVLVTSNGTRVFNEDQSFSSPSAAAAVVSGRSANGRISWKVEGRSMTYGEWQDQQVSAAAAAASE